MEPLVQALRASAEDPDAFGAIFDSEFERLLSRAVRQVFDSEIAVDIAAETLAEAFVNKDRFRGKTDRELAGWLNGIACHKISDFYRKAAVERRALNRIGIEPPELSEAEHREVLREIDEPVVRAVLKQALAELSSPQREALTLRIVDEVPYPALATRLGITEQAARQRVARALRALRRKLRKHRGLLEEGV